MEQSDFQSGPDSERKRQRRTFAVAIAAGVAVIAVAVGLAVRTSRSDDAADKRDAVAACAETNYAAVVATALSVNGMGFQLEERLAEYADHARDEPQWVRNAFADAIEQVVGVSEYSAISSITTATCRDYVERD